MVIVPSAGEHKTAPFPSFWFCGATLQERQMIIADWASSRVDKRGATLCKGVKDLPHQLRDSFDPLRKVPLHSTRNLNSTSTYTLNLKTPNPHQPPQRLFKQQRQAIKTPKLCDLHTDSTSSSIPTEAFQAAAPGHEEKIHCRWQTAVRPVRSGARELQTHQRTVALKRRLWVRQ